MSPGTFSKTDGLTSRAAIPGERDTQLSDDELGFLQTLFEACERDEDLIELGLIAAEAVVPLLFEMESLRLSADYGDHRFVFPMEIQDPAAGLKLRLRMPRIYDTRGNSRSWRALAERGDVEVSECSGQLRETRVVNLSISGISISASTQEAAPAAKKGSRLRLKIKVPDLAKPVLIDGKVVRRSVDTQAQRQELAIKFNQAHPELEEAICAYLLRAHREQLSLSGDD